MVGSLHGGLTRRHLDGGGFPREAVQVPNGMALSVSCFPRTRNPQKAKKRRALFLIQILLRKIPKFRSLAKEGRYEGGSYVGGSGLSQLSQSGHSSLANLNDLWCEVIG